MYVWHVVSPPSRRGRDREAGSGGGDALDTGSQQSGGPAFSNRTDERPRRGRKFDRHSGTGFVYGIIATHSSLTTTAINANDRYIGIAKRRSIKVGVTLRQLKKMRMCFLIWRCHAHAIAKLTSSTFW